MSDSKGQKDDRSNERLVTAEPGSPQYAKTGGAYAVDTDRVKGPGDFYPRSADEENLAAGPVSPSDPNYLEALRKTEGGQEQLDEHARGTDGDSTYGPTGDVTAASKDGSAKDSGAKDDGAGKSSGHTDRNVDVQVKPASHAHHGKDDSAR